MSTLTLARRTSPASPLPQVNILEDFAKFAAVPDTYAPPEAKPFAPREDLMSWLLDPRGRDQFAARFADETELYWNDAHSKRPDEVYRRSYWTESYVQWSPRGNYITTVHRQGIALWGGPQFARLARMQHPGVQFLEYSPGEKYIATCSVTEPTNPRESVAVAVSFFDVRSGRKLRGFTGGLEDFLLPGAASAAGARSVRARAAATHTPAARLLRATLTRARRVSPRRASRGPCSSGRAAPRTSTLRRSARTQSPSTRRVWPPRCAAGGRAPRRLGRVRGAGMRVRRASVGRACCDDLKCSSYPTTAGATPGAAETYIHLAVVPSTRRRRRLLLQFTCRAASQCADTRACTRPGA